MKNDFFIEKKIYYHDTDCGGVVYYANYLNYLEEARTEYLVEKGLDLDMLAKADTYFVVSDVQIKYKSPAEYQDILKVTAAITELRKTSIIFLQKIYKKDKLINESQVRLVCINGDFKPKLIPEEIKEKLTLSLYR